jgi:hypothetical protein
MDLVFSFRYTIDNNYYREIYFYPPLTCKIAHASIHYSYFQNLIGFMYWVEKIVHYKRTDPSLSRHFSVTSFYIIHRRHLAVNKL